MPKGVGMINSPSSVLSQEITRQRIRENQRVLSLDGIIPLDMNGMNSQQSLNPGLVKDSYRRDRSQRIHDRNFASKTGIRNDEDPGKQVSESQKAKMISASVAQITQQFKNLAFGFMQPSGGQQPPPSQQRRNDNPQNYDHHKIYSSNNNLRQTANSRAKVNFIKENIKRAG